MANQDEESGNLEMRSLINKSDPKLSTLKTMYQNKILEALVRKNFEHFNILLVSDYIDVNHIYPPHGQTCLSTAIIRRCGLKFVNSLLRAGANCNEEIENRAPLHLAIKYKENEIVERLLREKNIEVNIFKRDTSGLRDTPLNYLVKEATRNYKKNNTKENDFYVKCAEILLQNEADPNIQDAEKKTAIAIAAEKKHKELIRVILENSQYNVDIDKCSVDSGKTVREFVTENNLCTCVLPTVTIQSKKITKLFIHLRKKEVEQFIECLDMLEDDERDELHNKIYSLLRVAVKKKLKDAVDKLLRLKNEVKSIVTDNKKRLIDIVCFQGNPELLAVLLDNIEIAEEVLNFVALKFIKNECRDNEDVKACVTLLLEHKNMPINYRDVEGNTILYYVAQKMDDDSIELCLKRGATVATRNKINEFPLVHIDATVFENHLNACVTMIEKRGHDVIVIDFGALEPCEPAETTEFKHEMDLLRYMEGDKNYRQLLKHPVIETFIVVKCHRMRITFFIHFLFYLIFCIALFAYSYISVYESESDNAVVAVFRDHFFPYLVICLTVLLLTLEFTQVWIFKQYIQHFENSLDIVIIVLCIFIVADKNKLENFAIVNVLSVIRLVFHMAKFRYLSTQISMFKTVSWNFLKFILCYTLLLFTFSWSFIIVFAKNPSSNQTNSTGNVCNNEQNYFESLPVAFFKSFVMLTGEFNMDDIVLTSKTSYVVVILFIFLVSIVLFNLLNGLAVSDIQMIKNDAKLYALKSLIEEVSAQEDYFFIFERILDKFHLRIFKKCYKKLAMRFFNSVYVFPSNVDNHRMYILHDVNRKLIMQLERPDKGDILLTRKLIRSLEELAKKNVKKD